MNLDGQFLRTMAQTMLNTMIASMTPMLRMAHQLFGSTVFYAGIMEQLQLQLLRVKRETIASQLPPVAAMFPSSLTSAERRLLGLPDTADMMDATFTMTDAVAVLAAPELAKLPPGSDPKLVPPTILITLAYTAVIPPQPAEAPAAEAPAEAPLDAQQPGAEPE